MGNLKIVHNNIGKKRLSYDELTALLKVKNTVHECEQLVIDNLFMEFK